MVIACKKFHNLIYGLEMIKIYTDYQPLISVMKNEINKIGTLKYINIIKVKMKETQIDL